MMMHPMAHVLDNAVWHSLTGPRRALGERRGRAGRFDPEVAVFSAVEDPADPQAFADLLELIGPGRRAVLFAVGVVVPAGWADEHRGPGHQLVASGVDVRGATEGTVPLGAADVPEMLALIELTKPGPFAPRTVELGGYLGVRDDAGRLVAMAGERLGVDGFTEVSAVCTHPDVRGQGLATKLVLAVVDAIRARGDEAFLHVAEDNVNALRLYRSLGFVDRTMVDAVVVKAPR